MLRLRSQILNALDLYYGLAHVPFSFFFFFFNDTATTEIYTLSLHDALPIYFGAAEPARTIDADAFRAEPHQLRSEEHTSELQSQSNLVCRLLLEKTKKPRRAWIRSVARWAWLMYWQAVCGGTGAPCVYAPPP